MTWQASNGDSRNHPDGRRGAVGAFGVAAVGIGVAALAVATFILSYTGIRLIAQQAGIEPRYAQEYPLLLDAMLVIVLAAVLALRGAGLPSRMLSWLTLLVVLAAAAGADALHATGRTLPHNAAAITAAVLPWALVFVAFVLLFAVLRHARRHRRAAAPVAAGGTQPPPARNTRPALVPPLPVRTPQPWNAVSIVPGFSSQLVSSAAAGAAAGAADTDLGPAQSPTNPSDDAAMPEPEAEPTADTEPSGADLQLAESDTEDAQADVPTAETQSDEADAGVPTAADDAAARAAEADAPLPETAAPLDETDGQEAEGDAQPDEAEDDDMPVFHRMWSSPTPPEG